MVPPSAEPSKGAPTKEMEPAPSKEQPKAGEAKKDETPKAAARLRLGGSVRTG